MKNVVAVDFWIFFIKVYTSCSHVVRDFESEAKTRGNF